jgi:hypothetical protein
MLLNKTVAHPAPAATAAAAQYTMTGLLLLLLLLLLVVVVLGYAMTAMLSASSFIRSCWSKLIMPCTHGTAQHSAAYMLSQQLVNQQ